MERSFDLVICLIKYPMCTLADLLCRGKQKKENDSFGWRRQMCLLIVQPVFFFSVQLIVLAALSSAIGRAAAPSSSVSSLGNGPGQYLWCFMHQMGSTVQITRATEQQQLEFISVIEIVMNIPLIKQGLNENGFHGPKKPVDYNSKLSPCHRDLKISVFKLSKLWLFISFTVIFLFTVSLQNFKSNNKPFQKAGWKSML